VGVGRGGWGAAPHPPTPQPQIPNPQSPIPNPQLNFLLINNIFKKFLILINKFYFNLIP